MRKLALLPFVLLFAAAPLSAQDDEKAVRAVVDRMFDAMHAKDTTAFRSALHPDFRLVLTSYQEGQPSHRVIPGDAFVTMIGSATSELEERIDNVEIKVHDNVATVWNDYAFYVDGRLDHCGIDAFHLVRTTAGWKVVHVVDTQRAEGCRDIPRR
jgi:ketosteroid isomerase-like protein